MKVRRVEAVSAGVRVGELVRAGDPFGIDWLGREIRDEVDAVVVSCERYGDAWLVSYRLAEFQAGVATGPEY